MIKVKKTGRIYYGWVIVAATAAISIIAGFGRGGAYGIFIKPLSQEFGWGRATASLPASISLLTTGLIGPFAGRLFDRLGARRVVTLSLLMLAIATMSLRQANGLVYLLIVYGVVVPIVASGCSQAITSSLIARWFSRRRATAIALSWAGSSLSGLVTLPLVSFVLLQAGWRNTWLVLGAVVVMGIPLSLLLLRDRPPQPGGSAASTGARVAASAGPLEAHSWRQALRTRPIWHLMLAFAIMGFAGNPIFTHLVPLGIERGLSPTVAATAQGFMGSLNAIGMLFLGPLSDRMQRKTMLGAIYAVLGLSYMILVLVPGPLGIFAFAPVFGLIVLTTGILTTGLTADIYGVKHLGTMLGIVFLLHFLAGAAGIYVAGWIHDLTGTYTPAFAMFGATFIGAAWLAYTIRESHYSSRFQGQGTSRS